MTRGQPGWDTGNDYVNWPKDWETTGEGGLAVFLVVPDVVGWDDCAVPMPHFDLTGTTIVRGQEEAERQIWGFSQYDEGPAAPAQLRYRHTDLVACICLGTTGGAYRNEETGYFKAGLDDLTEDGMRLYKLLRSLYGVSPVLLTLLDT